MTDYGHDFYSGRHRRTVYTARTVLAIAAEVLPPVRSAVDLGCGVGTWLSVLAEDGVDDILGLDGAWVEKGLLEIPERAFLESDLAAPIRLGRHFDLAMSLEVAEHLPAASAGTFVDSLVGLSDFVLFSAAVPFQGGVHHVNEQWPDYWADLFLERGHVPWDVIRHRVWKDSRIPVWYRQNVLLFIKRERMVDLPVQAIEIGRRSTALSLVHPDLFERRMGEARSVRGSARMFTNSVGRWIVRSLRPR